MNKKRLYITIIACLSGLTVLIISVAIFLNKKYNTDSILKNDKYPVVTSSPAPVPDNDGYTKADGMTDKSGYNVRSREAQYEKDEITDGYFITDIDGEIVVYNSDKESVYEYTGIKTETFDVKEQNRLEEGYYVSDEEELYALLESYSS